MAIDLTTLTPQELVVLLIAIGGFVPIIVYRARVSRWVVLPYVFLALGAVLTNVEHLIWHDMLNLLEHSIANLGAGVAVAMLGYLGHRGVLTVESPRGDTDDA